MAKKESFNVLSSLDFMSTLKKQENVKTEEKELKEIAGEDEELEMQTENKVEETIQEKEIKIELKEQESSKVLVPEQKQEVEVIDSAPVTVLGKEFFKKKRETKTVRKSFTFSPTVDAKFSAMAEELEISQNDLINQILEVAFGLNQ